MGKKALFLCITSVFIAALILWFFGDRILGSTDIIHDGCRDDFCIGESNEEVIFRLKEKLSQKDHFVNYKCGDDKLESPLFFELLSETSRNCGEGVWFYSYPAALGTTDHFMIFIENGSVIKIQKTIYGVLYIDP